MKIEDVKIVRVLVEDTVTGANEIRDAESVMAFAIKDGHLMTTTVGAFRPSGLAEICQCLGAIIAAGAPEGEKGLMMARIALAALADGLTNRLQADEISAKSAENEVIYGVES